MLVLTRRPSESIIIAGDIKITVVNIGPGRVKLGIEAPSHVRVDRQEIHEKLEQSTDVLAAVCGGETASDAHRTTINSGADTVAIVAESGVSPTEPLALVPQPSKLSKYRLPRKSR